MNLDHQVTSLELSKQLKLLNIKQESIFVWEYYDDKCYAIKYIPYAILPDNCNKFQIYSAFTASELTEMLPNRITLKEGEPFNSFILYIKKSFIVGESNPNDEIPKIHTINPKVIYIINYECDSTECTGENAWFKRQLFNHNIWDENLNNALAKTLIKIKEEKYNET